VILACNTASAKALRTIQQNDLPKIDSKKRVLGVIRPSAEIIAQFSRTNNIGVLATPGTVSSDSYPIEIKKFSPQCEVFQHACPLWVTLIESNEHLSHAGKEFIRKDVEALMAMKKDIDTIVLGCTHYPVLKGYIESLLPEGINIVSQGNIVSDSLADYLLRHPWIDSKCTKNGTVSFLTSESTAEFNSNASKYIEGTVNSMHISL
jgi:glutamate racemase